MNHPPKRVIALSIERGQMRFALRTMFWLMNISALYCALVRLSGWFIGAVAMGPFLIFGLLVALRVQSMVGGLILGGFTALSVTLGSAFAVGVTPMEQVLMALLLCPPLGCLLGLLFVARWQVRTGL
ncbi:MAG: hypothetical protein AAGC97_19260 [Planctomycetota bacterium]